MNTPMRHMGPVTLQKRVTNIGIGALAVLMIATSCLSFLQQSTSATSIANWDAGKIMDDIVMINKDSMSISQIQNFLNSKVTACDTDGQQLSEYGGPDLNGDGKVQRWEWAKANYNQTTFTCLKDYSENGISAAQIIYNASQKYTINPQVLIVLLQKEQGLVTDTWPLNVQYKTATGYGCPDTAPCDSQYYGLTNQLNWSATMFRAIEDDSPTWYTPYILGDNFIQWSPNSSCGGTTVNIQNRATQALYNYTPYQPNQAALDAGYGMGDSCSAYGNRNFYLYFSDWFGSPNVPAFLWQPAGQATYTDETKSTKIGWNAHSLTGQKVYVQVKAKNMGGVTWTKDGTNDVLLGTWGPQDRSSPFCDATWIRCNRSATFTEPSVAPGEIGTFEFWMQAPTSAGSYRERFNLVAEGKSWMNETGMFIDYSVENEEYKWQPLGQEMFWDDTKSVSLGWNANIIPSQRFYAVMKVKNIGNITWSKSSGPTIKVATWNPQDRTSEFQDITWLRSNRIATFNEASVPPGGSATFEFWMQAPNRTGNFKEYLNLVAEGKTWLNPTGMYIGINSSSPVYSWQPAGQKVWTDDTKTSALGWNGSMAPGGRNYVEIYAKNTGNVPWVKNSSNPTLIGTWNPQDHVSPFRDASWVYANRMAVQQQDIVYPGQTAVYSFSVTAPETPGSYREYFNIVAESKTWLNSPGQFFIFNVQ